MRHAPAFALLLPLLGASSLSAQGEPYGNRFGLGFAAVSPQGAGSQGFGTGYQLSLQVHFNRESPNLGRLRIDYSVMDSSRPFNDGSIYVYPGGFMGSLMADVRRESYGVAYEWMPHFGTDSRGGPFMILGLGGMLWNERRKVTSPQYPYGSHTNVDLGLNPSLGFGYRFNVHLALEARLVGSFLGVYPGPPDSKSWEADGERHHLTFGASVRF